MKLDPTISLGNVITIAIYLLGLAGMAILWVWKYSKRDDAHHAATKKNTRDIKALFRMMRKMMIVTRKSTLAALIAGGKTSDEDLTRFLNAEDMAEEEDDEDM